MTLYMSVRTLWAAVDTDAHIMFNIIITQNTDTNTIPAQTRVYNRESGANDMYINKLISDADYSYYQISFCNENGSG